ncbi:MAG: hypothetical protein KF841_16785 [Phycisphaerae bacterium]|nr:hypothetical protein [Phycisphaerae bacterium]
MRLCTVVSVVSVVIWTGCSTSRESLRESSGPPPLFEDIGHYARWVQTDVDEAKLYFNQGLTWAFAFNHDEAIRSFTEAARLDPNCAMAYWGIALCNGPHINNPVMMPDRSTAAWQAAQKALALIDRVSYPEAQLIKAVAARYSPEHTDDRRALDEAYASAMKEVYELDVNDADVGTLYAESLMDLQPWDLWAKDGSPKGRTEEIIAVLEHALRINPNHPGANHLYIHAVEASPNPERGIASADRLRDLVPISGHLVHMPSHIDVQVGEWAKASDTNERAIAADERYRRISPKQGFYSVYMAHNRHFLAFSSMMEGRYALAIKAAREMIDSIPPEFIRDQGAFADPFMSIVFDVQKRFGRWDDILREPKPRGRLPISMVMYHFTRGVAHAAKGSVASARNEQKAMRAAVKKVPAGALTGINPAEKVLQIADKFLEGEILYRERKLDEAFAVLREAVAIEDDLLYMEPPEWIQPVRHALGAFLTAEKQYAQAEQVYREDLKIWPENGWSLHGLAVCLKAQGKTAEAADVEARFAKAWSRADVSIDSSCFCAPGARSCCELGR